MDTFISCHICDEKLERPDSENSVILAREDCGHCFHKSCSDELLRLGNKVCRNCPGSDDTKILTIYFTTSNATPEDIAGENEDLCSSVEVLKGKVQQKQNELNISMQSLDELSKHYNNIKLANQNLVDQNKALQQEAKKFEQFQKNCTNLMHKKEKLEHMLEQYKKLELGVIQDLPLPSSGLDGGLNLCCEESRLEIVQQNSLLELKLLEFEEKVAKVTSDYNHLNTLYTRGLAKLEELLA